MAIDVEQFIGSYNSEQRPRIAFEWNGKHAEEFNDVNDEFRAAVIDAVANRNASASVALLSNLLEEESSYSVQAWGAKPELSVLARKLLVQGGTACVLTFIRCKWKSFDTEMACADLGLPEDLCQELQRYCQVQADLKGPDRKLYEQGAVYFLSIASTITVPNGSCAPITSEVPGESGQVPNAIRSLSDRLTRWFR